MASASNVVLVNGAQAANVFWVVGSSATLGTSSILQGNILAQASITVTTGVTLVGRALARAAAVTLDTDTITRPTSVQAPTSTTTSLATSVNPAPTGQPVTFTAKVTAGTGAAIRSTSTLAAGLHPITAYYIGAGGFESSQSPEIFELVGYSWPAFRAMQEAQRAK